MPGSVSGAARARRDVLSSGDHGKYETGGRDLWEIKSIDIPQDIGATISREDRQTWVKKTKRQMSCGYWSRRRYAYQSYNYLSTGAISGVEVAQALGEDPDIVFKTLVTVGKSKEHYVFVIPVEKELNLKKAAKERGGEEHRDDQTEGAPAADRICPRRLLADRHEEAVHYHDR